MQVLRLLSFRGAGLSGRLLWLQLSFVELTVATAATRRCSTGSPLPAAQAYEAVGGEGIQKGGRAVVVLFSGKSDERQ